MQRSGRLEPGAPASYASRADLLSEGVAESLTVREREVVGLVAAGRTDGEIAAALFISKKTASVHVANIKGKLGASSRVEIAVMAARLRLVPTDLFQGADAGGASQPPRSGERHPGNLPVSLTSFMGREDMLPVLVNGLTTSPLVTITGPGGAGKTRLAVEVAGRLLARFPGGAWFVDLSAAEDGPEIVPAIAAELGVADRGGGIEAAVIARLEAQPTLLVLDNLEQVRHASAPVGRLLRAVDTLRILATSRAPLQVAGEQAFTLPPLHLEPTAADTAAGVPSAAVRLFLARASAVRPGMDWDAEARASIEAVCRRLDGLPLAIELAAARIRLFTPGQLLERLGARIAVLESRSEEAPVRHRSLRLAIAWSEDLLPAAEATAFHRLAVFEGAFDLPAAEAVTGLAPDACLEVISALVDHSLLRPVEMSDGVAFAMLETIRAYALERLEAVGEEGPTRDRHAAWYAQLGMGELAALYLADPERLADRVRTLLPNLRAALAHAAAVGDAAWAASIATTLGRWHIARLEERAALAALVPVEPLVREAPPAERGAFLATLQRALMWNQRSDEAEHVAQRAREALVLAGDREAVVRIDVDAALSKGYNGQPREAILLLERLLADEPLPRESRLPGSMFYALSGLTSSLGDIEGAVAYAGLAFDARPATRDRQMLAALYCAEGHATLGHGREALAWLDTARQLVADADVPSISASIATSSAEVHFQLGDIETSLAHVVDARARVSAATVNEQVLLGLVTIHVALAAGDQALAVDAFRSLLADGGPPSLPINRPFWLESAALVAAAVGLPAEALALYADADAERIRHGTRLDGAFGRARDACRAELQATGALPSRAGTDAILRTLAELARPTASRS